MIDTKNTCIVCLQEGKPVAVEKLPNEAVLYMVAHDDGRLCKWSEAKNMEQAVRAKAKHGGSPIVKCPRCGKEGRLNWKYHPSAPREERLFTIDYLVTHKRTQEGDRDQCQHFNPRERRNLLKQSGQYISDPPKAKRRRGSILENENSSKN